MILIHRQSTIVKAYQIALIVISITFSILGYCQSYYQYSIVDVAGDNSLNRDSMMIMNEDSTAMKGLNASTGQSSSSSSSSSFSFNPDVPILVPLVEGYYNGTKVYFIHTETSEKSMSDMMTKMIRFKLKLCSL